jgi:type VI secretion system protein ImpA
MAEAPDDADTLPPVSAEAPCGPDLDAEGDAEYMNFMAGADGQLPAAFYSFDRKNVDFAALFDKAGKLLTRTHDLRLVVLVAKFSILNRDFDGFAHWLAVAARLLRDHWDDVHPRGEEGDFAARSAQLATLEDAPVILLPLQNTPLAETRDGVLTFRSQLIALGEIKLREGEAQPNSSAIEKILLNVDMARLTQTVANLQSVKASIAQIRSIWLDRAGFDNAPNFEALTPLVDRILTFVQTNIAKRDPSLGEPPPADGSEASREVTAGAPSQFASLPDVDAALASALAYFENVEPSSAAVLLIGQARNLLGRNLYEVMKVLAPAHADNARVFVGADTSFTVPVNAIAAKPSLAETFERASPEPAVSRAAAIALIESVATHLRRVEPSSPLPWLLDRAKALASRDFISLLKDLLSEDIITQMKSGY